MQATSVHGFAKASAAVNLPTTCKWNNICVT